MSKKKNRCPQIEFEYFASPKYIINIILFGKEIQTLNDKCQQKILQPLERRGHKKINLITKGLCLLSKFQCMVATYAAYNI